MKLKKNLLYLTTGLCLIGCLTGCADNKKEVNKEETKTESVAKGNCKVTECIKQLEVTNTVEEINDIIGFEGTKSEFSEERTWKLDDKNWITLKYAGESPILQATIDKETIKNDEVTFPKSSELKEILNNGSLTYEELVEKLGGVAGTVDSKTKTSVGYIWVNKNNQTLSATFNNESGKCTVASYR